MLQRDKIITSFKTFWGWLVIMSGPVSIACSFVALFGPENRTKEFAILAYAALWVLVGQLAWKNYHLTVIDRPKRNRVLLKKMVELIKSENKSTPPDSRMESIGALIECSEEIETEADVEWFCDELVKHRYGHPFEVAELYMDDFMRGQRLSVLREASLFEGKIKSQSHFIWFLDHNWSGEAKWKEAIKKTNDRIMRSIQPEPKEKSE